VLYGRLLNWFSLMRVVRRRRITRIRKGVAIAVDPARSNCKLSR